ncbi:hypothetical protein SK128_024814, partial [Halocaridina rubra]
VDTNTEDTNLDKQETAPEDATAIPKNMPNPEISSVSTLAASVGIHFANTILPTPHSSIPLTSDSLDSISHTSSPINDSSPTPEPIYESFTTSVDSPTTATATASVISPLALSLANSTPPALLPISTSHQMPICTSQLPISTSQLPVSTSQLPISTLQLPVSSTCTSHIPITTPQESSPTPPAPIMENSSPVPQPLDMKDVSPTPTATVEEEEDEVDDQIDEDLEAASENSDLPSSPSTPSPPPRGRGRGRSRGRGRPHTKRHNSSGKSESPVMRRGRRRRTTRFTLAPDDNSDFEEQLAISELQDENSMEEVMSDERYEEKSENDNGLSDAEICNESSSGPASVEGCSRKATYSSAPLTARSKPIEPDVFEFHDSTDNVLPNNHDTTYSLKHNSPFVFREDESSQGARDVNENLGSVGETASA